MPMDEFELYERMRSLERIAKEYDEGKTEAARIGQLSEDIKTHRYSVVIVGEFKKGKSSLINAILGTKLLPMDVLPMTAAVCRVVYGSEQDAFVEYRDGQRERVGIEEVKEYATKYSEDAEQRALSIREIQLIYPSVFCRSHIELIDTPGLNDRESMSNVTLEGIKGADAALVVISAAEPLSLTEQGLVLDLIEDGGIRHIVFVVTHIDILKKEGQVDRILGFIRQRLQKEVLLLAEERFSGNEVLLVKAREILGDPTVFGVSSSMALSSFDTGDVQLLQESRLPDLKEKLLTILTSAQTKDIVPKCRERVAEVSRSLPGWYEAEKKVIHQTRDALLSAFSNYKREGMGQLQNSLYEMEKQLMEQGLGEEGLIGENQYVEAAIRSFFVPALSEVNSKNNTDKFLLKKLDWATAETTRTMENTCLRWKDFVCKGMKEVVDMYIKNRAEVSLEIDEFRKMAGSLNVKPEFLEGDSKVLLETKSYLEGDDFPEFSWKMKAYPSEGLVGKDLIPKVWKALFYSVNVLGKEMNFYIRKFRVEMIGLVKEEIIRESMKVGPFIHSEEKEMLEAANARYQLHRTWLDEIEGNV